MLPARMAPMHPIMSFIQPCMYGCIPQRLYDWARPFSFTALGALTSRYHAGGGCDDAEPSSDLLY